MTMTGELLKKFREMRGLTQKQVSDKLGYSSPQFVSNWERGVSMPPMNSLKKVARILKLEKETLGDHVLADFETELRELGIL